MKINIDKILDKWTKTGLLETSKNKLSLALCLETQRRYNESNGVSDSFRRLAIPLIVRMLNGSKTNTRNNFINYFDEQEKPKAYIFKSKFKNFNGDIEKEAEFAAELAENMAKELDYLFNDKMNNDIIFRGLDTMQDGSILFYYN
jgi:hypothetical protein